MPQKNTAAYNLSDYYYQEIFDFLVKKPGERNPKRLMEEIDKKKKIGEILLKTKRRSFQKKENYYNLKLSISKQLRNSKYLKI